MSQDPENSLDFEQDEEEEKASLDQVKDHQLSKEQQQIITYLNSNVKIQNDILDLLKKPQPDLHHDFIIDVMDFFDEAPQFASMFFNEPKLLVQYFQQAIIFCQNQKQQELEEKLEQQRMQLSDFQQEANVVENNFNDKEIEELGEIKESVQIKFINVPYTQNIYKKNLSDIDVYDLDKIVILSGTVIRSSQIKTLEKQKTFKCVQCENEVVLQAEPENYNQFILPQKCTNSVQKPRKENPWTLAFSKFGGKNKFGNQNMNKQQAQKKFVDQMCGGKKFEAVDGTQVYVDYQEVKIQEPFKTIKSGNIPKTIWVLLEGTLVNSVKPGDDATITGILIKRNKKLVKDSRPDLNMAIVSNNIDIKHSEQQQTSQLADEIKENQFIEEIQFFWSNSRDLYSEIEARNMIIKSMCPYIYQKYDVKLGILLCLIGGVSGIQNNTRIRGQCHILMIGEPGTGKSQMLKYAAKLSARSVFTNGIGTTSAGLTVSYTKDSGEWMIEAGALVLADKGVCCIDEFNLIKKQDFASILEAMEQQTISGLKAGMMTKLNTRTTVLAAANPISAGQKYNPQYDLSQNTGLSSPLISRFDMIFVIIDECNYEADIENCDFILGRFMKKENRANKSFVTDKESTWDIEKLRQYIQIVKQKFMPTVNEEAEKILVKYYQHLRNVEEMHSKTTIRALESLVRLSQAHARLMFKQQAEQFDAVCVIILMESAFNTNLFPDIQINQYITLNYDKYMQIEELIKVRLDIPIN